jgi:1-aminocyclopropane-1-carboxylate deaminase
MPALANRHLSLRRPGRDAADVMQIEDLVKRLAAAPRVPLATLPTPLHPLPRLTTDLAGPELWIKRDDLTGLAGGGNKTRKLEFLVGDALRAGADTLVTVGAIQSNHTRQTAAAAARVGLAATLLHNNWTDEPGGHYRSAGNILLSDLLGADRLVDNVPRRLGDAGVLDALVEHLRRAGRRPYLIPGGGSDHPLGGLGYVAAAAEVLAQAADLGVHFDAIVHCTGSSGTQAGLLAGLTALGSATRVVGVSDDDETDAKVLRVRRIANRTLARLGCPERVPPERVEIIVADSSPYGVADELTIEAIRRLARGEGLIADPVYEGKAVRGLIQLVKEGHLGPGHRVLLLHMGGTPAVHGYADLLGVRPLVPAEALLSPDAIAAAPPGRHMRA